jgi:hypothetical protein
MAFGLASRAAPTLALFVFDVLVLVVALAVVTLSYVIGLINTVKQQLGRRSRHRNRPCACYLCLPAPAEADTGDRVSCVVCLTSDIK